MILTTHNSCHNIFTHELRRGFIHNGFVKVDSNNNRIVGFKMGHILLEENPSYHTVKYTMETLNINIGNDSLKYNYTGQSIHRLAYQYYTNNYDKNIISHCSPQVYDILTDKDNINSPFYEFYCKVGYNKGTVAYDINKQYTNILMNCDMHGWSIFSTTDEVKPVAGNITTGIYYV